METIPQFGPYSEHLPKRYGAYAVIYNHENKILTDYHQSSQKYYLPGGGIEKNENAIETIVRETREETGYEVKIIKKIGNANQAYKITKLGPMNKCGQFFLAELVSYNQIPISEKNSEARWLTYNEFMQSNTAEFYKWAVQKTIQDEA